MTKSQTYCDECRKPKGDESGWRKIGVAFDHGDVNYIMVGNLIDDQIDRIDDVCGESCFHRHIDKLLQLAMTPSTTIPASTATPIPNCASDSPSD